MLWNSFGHRTAAISTAVLIPLTLLPGELAAQGPQGQPVENASHLPVWLWFVGAGLLGLALAYGIMRNRQRTRTDKVITEQATKD